MKQQLGYHQCLSTNNQDSDIDQDLDSDQDLDTMDGQNSDDGRSSSGDGRSSSGDGMSSDQDSGSDEERAINTKWKEGLANKTTHLKRINLQHLIYNVNSTYSTNDNNDSSHAHTMMESEGVLLRYRHDNQHKLVHQRDGSCIRRSCIQWSDEQMTVLKTLCVTGSWGDDDAAVQLQSSSDEDVTMETDHDKLVAKKQELKAQFNEEYDNKEGNDYFTEMKERLAVQAELNKSTFEGVADELRWQLEGFPAGYYVRMEIKGIPCELIEKFDPRQPLIVGGLSPGEEQLSFLQVGGAVSIGL